MGRAKEIRVSVIASKVANEFVKKYHYSSKVVNNSVLHFGAFLDNRLHGVMSFGSPLDKRKVLGLVEGTKWNEMLELNRMAFDDYLPKNSESRCISIAIRLIKKNAPHIKWILSFADGAQCGDGAIYRASGFYLTGVKENDQIIEFPDGLRETRLVLTDARRPRRIEVAQRYGVVVGGGCTLKPFLEIGAKAILGFQLRYIYLIDKSSKLTCPVLPFSKIDEMGARIYKGIRGNSLTAERPAIQSEGGVQIDLAALKTV